MNDWQKNLCNEIMLGGITKGELIVMTAGRGVGKSQLNQYITQWQSIFGDQEYGPVIEIVDSALVDDEPWYTIQCHKTPAAWIRQQRKQGQWYEHPQERFFKDMFDVSEPLLIQLRLKFA